MDEVGIIEVSVVCRGQSHFVQLCVLKNDCLTATGVDKLEQDFSENKVNCLHLKQKWISFTYFHGQLKRQAHQLIGQRAQNKLMIVPVGQLIVNNCVYLVSRIECPLDILHIRLTHLNHEVAMLTIFVQSNKNKV